MSDLPNLSQQELIDSTNLAHQTEEFNRLVASKPKRIGPVWVSYYLKARKMLGLILDKKGDEGIDSLLLVNITRLKAMELMKADITIIKQVAETAVQTVEPVKTIHKKRDACEINGKIYKTAKEAVIELSRDGKLPMPPWRTWSGFIWLTKHKIDYKRVSI